MANLLIIDDDVQMAQMLMTHFSQAGHSVTVVHKGQEGLDAAHKQTPDLILLDVILPDLTGYQLCSRFRQNPKTQTTPILMMTGFARNSNQQVFGFERGANEYILKPLDLVELGETVQRYLNAEVPLPGMSPKPVVTPLPSLQQSSGHNDFFKLRNFFKNVLGKSKTHS
jgi:DNA-binding response OmpR family regulator